MIIVQTNQKIVKYLIFFLAGPLTEEERLNRQPRSIQDQIVSTAAQCMKGVVNRFKDSGFDIDCLQSNNCNQADVNRLANNALGYLEKVQGGGCMTNSNCSPISRCNSKYLTFNFSNFSCVFPDPNNFFQFEF